jgi:ketosteroid isomerase-like protein
MRLVAPALSILVLSSSCASMPPCPAPAPAPNRRAEIEAFNRAMIEATTRMDDAGIVALWEDDGVTLLPQAKPIAGKKAIAAFIAQVTEANPGAKMRSFEMTCSGIEIAGDVASEYCDEHQVVDIGGDKPPFDGRGKLLFVLHRGADGSWRLRREMWNQGSE